MELDELRRALGDAASESTGDAASARAAVDARARAHRVRRWSVASAVAVVAVAAVVIAVVVVPNDGHHDLVRVAPNSTGRQLAPTPIQPASATAAQLIAGHWSSLPPAPIPSRGGDSVVWTGHELIVWGGDTAANLVRADGAAYNPTTNTWRPLPASPLSPRTGQAAVWTGTEMLVWGGSNDPTGAGRVRADGAAYNPTTDKWRVMSVGPLAPRSDAIAVWTGDRMIVLGGNPAILTGSPGTGGFTDGASYDPESDEWQKLSAPARVGDHPLDWRTAIQAGPNRLLAWSQWALTNTTGPGSAELSGGADLFALDEATLTWRAVPTAANSIPSIDQVLWTGDRALVRGIPYNCGECPGPFVAEVSALYDPANNTWKRLPPDPLGGQGMPSVWTGSALWSLDAGSQSSGPQYGSVNPGDSTVYDPATGRWARLLSSPACNNIGSPIWTGAAILMTCSGLRGESGVAYVPPVGTSGLTLDCPATSTADRPRSGQRAGTAETIVPGHPVALIACRYYPRAEQRVTQFAAEAVLPASEVATEVNTTQIYQPGARGAICQPGDGERYVLRFSYPAGTPLDVYVADIGCAGVDNGDIAGPNAPPALMARLHAELGQETPP